MFEALTERFPELHKIGDHYAAYWHRMEVPAGTALLREGDIARKIFIIEKGCVRAWMNNEGREITFEFIFEGAVAVASESFRKEVPAFFNLQAIEPAVLYWIHKGDWEKMTHDLEDIPGMTHYGTEVLLERQYTYLRKFISMLNETPQQRYINLLQQDPRVVRRVPLRHIATYLGITPVSLSRIRKRVGEHRETLPLP